MRKSLFALSIAAALISGQAMADEATLSALLAAGVPLTTEQVADIRAAEGDALADAVAAVVSANPTMAAAIVSAAVKAAPDQATAITSAAVFAAPQYESAITEAAVNAAPADQATAIRAAARTAALAAKDAGMGADNADKQTNNTYQPGGGGNGDNVASPNTVIQ